MYVFITRCKHILAWYCFKDDHRKALLWDILCSAATNAILFSLTKPLQTAYYVFVVNVSRLQNLIMNLDAFMCEQFTL